MRKLLKSTVFNAVCIGLFTGFYALLFLLFINNADYIQLMTYNGGSNFWQVWSNFLLKKNQIFIVWTLVAVTAVIAVLLLLRRRPYDEYHSSILKYCLVIAAILTLAAIGIFFLIVIIDPYWILGKFTLFIVVHWITVTLSNLVFILICTWS